MLEIQKYLQQNTLQSLKDNFFINIGEYDKFYVFNYSQIESPKNNDIVNECRGLILDKEYNVICRSFDRFYNYGENGFFPKDLYNYIAWEKRDGTLITVYFNDNKWNCATRKMAFAEGEINGFQKTFNSLFLDVFSYDTLLYVDKDLCLMFELTSNINRIVTRYKKTEVRLLGVRNKVTGIEYNYVELKEFAEKFNFILPKEFKFLSYEEAISSFLNLEPLEEGYVLVDYHNFKRVKIKNPSYLAVANIRVNGIISERSIINLIFSNDYVEYLLSFEEDTPIFDKYIKAYNDLVTDTIDKWKLVYEIKDQKQFALAVKKFSVQHLLFAMKAGKSLSEIFERLTDNSKLLLVKNYL